MRRSSSLLGSGTPFASLPGIVMLLLVAGTAQAQAPAGVAAAVNPGVTGTPPALPTQMLEVGSDVVRNEHVKTDADGQTQLLFRDGSTMTLGPGADLTIDNFVYDPDTKTAKLAMTATVGVFRFVGGRASKDEPVVVNTPTATIGIRGGINFTTVAPGTGDTETSQAFGRDTTATSTSTGEERVLTKNGFAMNIKANQPITTDKIDLARLTAMLSSFQGRPGASGGGTPVDQNAPSLRNVANSNSSLSPFVSGPGSVTIPNPLGTLQNLANQLVSQTAQTIVSGAASSGSVVAASSLAGAFTAPTGAGGLFFFDAQSALSKSFDSAGALLSLDSIPPGGTTSQVEDNFAITRISAQAVEQSGNAVLQIGRWTNGSYTITESGASYTSSYPTTVGPNQGLYYVIGVPATLMPTAGVFNYSLMGATSPTLSYGGVPPGSFTGSMSVLFTPQGAHIGLNYTVALQTLGTFQSVTSGGLANPAASEVVSDTLNPGKSQQVSGVQAWAFENAYRAGVPLSSSSTSRVLTLVTNSNASACLTGGCLSFVKGMFAGPGGPSAGFTYIIQNVNGSLAGASASNYIIGVAAFRRN